MSAPIKGRRDPHARAFVRDYVAERGFGPTYREIGHATGVRSAASVHRMVERMRARGELARMPGKTRRATTVPELLEAGDATERT